MSISDNGKNNTLDEGSTRTWRYKVGAMKTSCAAEGLDDRWIGNA